ncbi:MAG: hypothetical protein QXM98_04615, partial [Thermoproteota archaeon]
IGLVINTPDLRDKETLRDMYVIRRTAVEFAIPVVTSLEVAERIIEAMRFKNNNHESAYTPCSLDEFHRDIPLSKYV